VPPRNMDFGVGHLTQHNVQRGPAVPGQQDGDVCDGRRLGADQRLGDGAD
jgi:hypothetical protein